MSSDDDDEDTINYTVSAEKSLFYYQGHQDKQYFAKIYFLCLERRINGGYRHGAVNGEYSLQPDGDHGNTREGSAAF